jgi:hypothetical protein
LLIIRLNFLKKLSDLPKSIRLRYYVSQLSIILAK